MESLFKNFSIGNLVMATVMVIGLFTGYNNYIEGKIEDVRDEIPEVHDPYDDAAIRERLAKFEDAELDSRVDLIIQKVDGIKTYDPTQVEADVNEIKVMLGKFQTELENLKEHDHNGTYLRRDVK